jgi:hypothetical protein
MFLWEFKGGKPCIVPFRLMAAKLGVHERTAQAHVYRLEKLGELGVRRKRIAHRRNAPNLYTFPKLAGFLIEKENGEITVEKPEQIKKLTAPPRAARVENHFPAMRRLYEHNGRLWKLLRRVADAKAHRLHKAEERTRIAMRAGIGSLGYCPKPSEAEIAAKQAQEQQGRDDALFYWRSMKAKGQAIYERQCPGWARRIIEDDGMMEAR